MVVWSKVCLLWEDQNMPSLIYIDGKGMLCSLCHIFDTKQHNGFRTWYNTANIRYCPDTIEGHFKSEMNKYP